MSRGRDEGSPAVGAEPWRELNSGGNWDDLVLPDDFATRLRETADLCRHPRRSGIADSASSHRLLFAGPSGMGKTSVALALAAELGQPVLEVDVTELIATDAQERSDQLVNHAREWRGILVLDRADPLLRPRRRGGTPREDRAEALARVIDEDPALPDVVILCAERVPDEAHGTRLHFDQTFNFPEPSAEIRARIWERHLPADHLVASSDLAFIAQAFRLSGRVVAACCGRARLRADSGAVTLRDVAVALDAEFENRLTSDSTLAALHEVHRRAERAERAQPDTINRRPGLRDDEPELKPSLTAAPRPDAVRPAPVVAGPSPSVADREAEPQTASRERGRWVTRLAIALVGAIAAVALGIALSNHGNAHSTTTSRSTAAKPPVAETAYRAKLSQALGTLNQARSRFGAALASARTPTTQAQAAAALAAAHLVAASTLGALNAGRAAAANQTLVAALRAAGNAYGALAQAAYKSNAGSYAKAKGQVAAASAAVTAAVSQIQTALG